MQKGFRASTLLRDQHDRGILPSPPLLYQAQITHISGQDRERVAAPGWLEGGGWDG